MLDTTKRTLATLTAAACLGAAGWAIAADSNGAAGTQAAGTSAANGTGYGPGPGPGAGMGRHGRMMGTETTGAAAAKVKAAVLAKLPGATVERIMTAPDGTYHAHVTKRDGTRVHVAVSTAFAVTSVDQGRPGMGRHGRMMGTETTGAAAAKVKAVVLAKLPGATVERIMTAPDGTYHAHVTKQDGTRVHVAVSTAFAVTSVDAGPPKGGPGRMGTETTGAAAAKVKAAVLAKLPGATVERIMTAPDGTYHAHVTKADGARVHVAVSKAFAVTAVEEGHPGMRRHG